MNKKRKVPLRKCLVTMEQRPKQEMFRIVRTPDKEVVIDLHGKVNGRGAYLSKSKDVILEAKKRRVLDKHLEVEVPEQIYLDLINLLEGANE